MLHSRRAYQRALRENCIQKGKGMNMKRIIEQGWKITGAMKCVELEIEYSFGGHTDIVYIGDTVHIETKFGNAYDGLLIDFKCADKEGEQDSLYVKSETGELLRIGIHDISLMEGTYERVD